jgi:hypothetical protein
MHHALIKPPGSLGAARLPGEWRVANAEGAVNAAFFDASARRDAERGATVLAVQRLPAGSTLYRIGNSAARHADDNFSSAWWLRLQELELILRKGQRDTAWAGRVMLAIAEAFGSRCDLQISVQTTCDLDAWLGAGKALSKHGQALPHDDPNAYWWPEPGLTQLYVPGLRQVLPGHSSALWRSAFSARQRDPWLPIGQQTNLSTGQPYSNTRLPAGRR